MDYTASDLLGAGTSFLLFALFAFAPGYTFGWLSNVFEFRQRRLATRIAASVPLSIGLTPISAYFLWRWSLPLVWIAFGACGVMCAVLLVRDARMLRLNLTRAGWLVAAIAAGWLVIATFSLVDLQIGNRLYFPFSAHDLGTHTAFTAALARDGIPPHNPFFFAGQPAPLRYHYFWYIPCALVDRMSGLFIGARLSVIAGILWAILGLFGIIALYLRFFQEKGSKQIERRILIGVSLLGITGLDILPTLLFNAASGQISPSIEWWNEEISAWVTTALWAPHDMAALVAGLAGFLLAWNAARQPGRGRRIAGLVGAGLAFASSTGSSIYVGGTLAVGCVLWLAIAFFKRWWRQVVIFAAAGTVAAALLTPFLMQLTHGGGTPNAAVHSRFPFMLRVRTFTIVDAAARSESLARVQMLNAAVLPLNYFLEFGFFFVVGYLGVRRMWRNGVRSQAEWAALALGGSSLLICTFVVSSVIKVNDLGFRSALWVQFILLLWAVEMWSEGIIGFGRPQTDQDRARRIAPRFITVMLVLGAMGSCYEVGMQHIFPVLSDLHAVKPYDWMAPDQQLGRRTFALRKAYSELDRIFPANAVIQADPENDIGNIPAQLYSDRQMVADVGNCGTSFGGSKRFCDEVILPRLKPIFDDGDPVRPTQVEATCKEFSIKALLFRDTDPVWKDKTSWIWKAQPLVSNDFVRVIGCGR